MDIARLIEMMQKDGKRRNYSPRTIDTYNHALRKFFRIYSIDPRKIKKNDIENYVDQMIKWNKSYNTINVHVSALKYFYEKVLKKRCTINIPIAKKTTRIPTYLEKDEIVSLINCISNKKHRLMVSLLYSSGMRVSELLNLKVKDLNFKQLQGWVREGKGRKDRPFIIAKSLFNELTEWGNKLGNNDYLFSNKDKPMSSSTVRIILKKAAKKANIKKGVHPHTLRHSFATHLANNGYSASEIQPILGHKSIETTLIYTHIANLQLLNIKSPLDSLVLNENSTS
jgi:integrase/recombinase XerD